MDKLQNYAPYMIASRIKMYNEADTYAQKFDLLEKIYTQTLRYFSCICLSEYLYQSETNQRINMAINALIRPSIGNWLSFLKVYVSNESKEIFINELPVILKKLYKTKVDVLTSDISNLEAYERQSLLDCMVIFRNNLRHGAYVPDEQMYKAYTEVYEPYITQLLNTLSSLFIDYKVVNCSPIVDEFAPITFKIMHGDVTSNFNNVEYDCEDIPSTVELNDGSNYLVDCNNNFLPLHIIFENYFTGSDEDIIIYDGLNKKSIRYVGLNKTYSIEKYTSILRKKFTDKKIALKFGRKTINIDSLKNYINELSSLSISIHERSGKYNKKCYIKRKADSQVYDFIDSDKTGMIITADAGSGKTTLMCDICRQLIEKSQIVYFINAYRFTNMSDNNAVFKEFKDEIISEDSFTSILDFLEIINKLIYSYDSHTQKQKFVLVVDAVNEAYNPLNVLKELDRIITQSPQYDWLKVIFTIRSESFRRLNHYINERLGKKISIMTDNSRYYTVTDGCVEKNFIKIKNWTVIQQIDAFNKYKSTFNVKDLNMFQLSYSMWNLISMPLNMKILFYLLSQGIEDINSIVNQKELFSAYHSIMINEEREISKATNELLEYSVKTMIDQKKSSLEIDFIDSKNEELIQREKIIDNICVLTPYERLLDVGILQQRLNGRWYEVRFVYQAYLEYLIYMQISRENYTNKQLVELTLTAIKLNSLPELLEGILYVLTENSIEFIDILELLLREVKDETNYKDLKEGIVKACYKTIIEADETCSSHAATGITKCITEYDAHELVIDLGNRLFKSNALTELKALYLEFTNNIDKAEKNNIYTAYYSLGVISQLQCESVEETVSYFEKAYQYGSGEQQLQSIAMIGKTYRLNSMVDKAIKVLNDAVDGENNLDDMIYALIDLTHQRQLCYRANKQLDISLALSRENYLRREKISDPGVRLMLKSELGNELDYSKHIDESIEIANEVIIEAAEIEEINLMVDNMRGLANRYSKKGDYDKALHWAQEGIMLWEFSKNYRGLMALNSNIVVALKGKNASIEQAQPYINKCHELTEKVNEDRWLEKYAYACGLWGIEPIKKPSYSSENNYADTVI